MSPQGRYWYKRGANMRAFYALIPAVIVVFICTVPSQLKLLADFSLFVGAVLASALYRFLMANPPPPQKDWPARDRNESQKGVMP